MTKKQLEAELERRNKSLETICELFRQGKCMKYEKPYECEPSSMEWFEEEPDELEVIEPETMCRKGSIWGNLFFKITEEQLEALKEGKVLFNLDEYGVFIALERGKK